MDDQNLSHKIRLLVTFSVSVSRSTSTHFASQTQHVFLLFSAAPFIFLHTGWSQVILNKQERAEQDPSDTDERKRNWGWLGYTQKPASSITRQVLSWNPQGIHSIGRPKQRWCRSVKEELKAGMEWNELGRTCQNRLRWRSIVSCYGPVFHKELFI